MIGRGIYGRPWLFNPQLSRSEPAVPERLEILREHARLFTETYGPRKNFADLRKYFNSYTSGFPAAKPLRLQLMETKNLADVEAALDTYITTTLPAPHGRAQEFSGDRASVGAFGGHLIKPVRAK